MSFTYIVSYGIKTSPSVEGIGFTKDINHSHFGPGQRKGYTIHYNLNGRGFFNGNLVKANQGFLVYDGMFAEHHPHKDDPWELLWITISGELCDEIFARYNADKQTNIFDFSPDLHIQEVVETVINCETAHLDSLYLLNIFLGLHCRFPQINNSNDKKNDTQIYIDCAVRYIKNNLHCHITVEQLTKITGVSQPYLYKLFQNEFHMSPKNYIMKLKVDTAKKMLVNTDMTVTEIAKSIGYEDVLVFSRMFSRREGLSAVEYRKASKSKNIKLNKSN